MMSEPLIQQNDTLKQIKMAPPPNNVPENLYIIDGTSQKQNKTTDMMTQQQHLTEGQLNYNDYEKMDLPTQQDILLSTLCNFLVEPPLSVPMTLGLYSRWGSGKTSYLERLTEFFNEYKEQSSPKPFTISFLLTMACFVTGLNFGLIASAVAGRETGGIVGMCVGIGLMAIFLFCRLSVTSSNNSMRNFAIKFTVYYYRFIIFLKMIYCLPPPIEEYRAIMPVHVVVVDFTQKAVKAEDPISLFVNFMGSLNNAVENDIGMFIPRLYRIFQAPKNFKTNIGRDLYAHWKTSCCCIPSFMITVVIFLCLWIAIILYNVYDLPGPMTVMAIQIACCCVFGGGLCFYLYRIFLIMYCMFLPMKKRVEIVANRAGIHEDTFLSVLKHELDLYVDLIECIDGFNRRQTRIVVNIDLVDTLEQQKVLNIINSMSLLLTEPGYPFIVVLSVDPRLLIRAIDQTLSNMQEPMLSPCEYLKNMVDLPCYINEYQKLRTERIIEPNVLAQIQEKLLLSELSDNEDDEEIEWDNTEDLFSGTSAGTMSEVENGHAVPIGDGTTSLQRSVKFPSDQSLTSADYAQTMDDHDEEGSISEDISHLLRNNENNSFNDVKRIMNIVSLKGRLLRYQNVNFQWTRLAIWVSFCDGWPHKASWLTLICLDPTLNLPGHMSLRRLNNVFSYLMPSTTDRNLGVDNSNSYFETFIASHKIMLTVTDIRSFAVFIFYIDPTIRKQMIDYLLSLRMKHDQNKTSSDGTRGPDQGDHQWMNVVRPEVLIRMSVDDVVNQLLQIEGLNEQLLQEFKRRLLDNNINGRVLMACDLNDLRDVMQMKFGDWQLFRAWIIASRNKDQQQSTTAAYDSKKTIESTTSDTLVMQQADIRSTKQSKQNKGSTTTTTSSKNTFTRGVPSRTAKKVDKKQPYASHLTPQYKRKALKDMKTSVSQDSDSSTPQNLINDNVLHHTSIDSGFASTEVDQNHRLMLNLQRQSCVPEFEEPAYQTIPEPTTNQLVKRNSDLIDIEMDETPIQPQSPKMSNSIKTTTTTVDTNESPLILYNENDQESIASGLIETTIETTNELLDKPNELCTDNILVPVDDNQRPPSLSEVPLPPMSMLDDSAPWPMSPPAEFDDNNETQMLPSPSKSSDKSINSHNVYYEDFSMTLDDSLRLNTHKKSTTMSEPYAIDYSSTKKPSLKKSASVGYYDYEKKPTFKMSTLDRRYMHDQDE